MIKKLFIILVAVTGFVLATSAEPHFYTKLHQSIYQKLHLDLPDTLNNNQNLVLDYQGKRIRVRTNGLGDVSHIGYKLFHDDVLGFYDSFVFFDFLERYFLELDLRLDKRSPAERMDLDKVDCQGNVSLLGKITENTPFTLDFLERRRYKISWTIGKQTLSLTIPADCQLLLGADAIELEEIFKRDVCRIPAKLPDYSQKKWTDTSVSADGGWMIANSGSYLSDEIRSDIYLQKKKGSYQVVTDPNKVIQSVKNILLTGASAKPLPMHLKIDQYGYKSSEIDITLQQFLEYCRKEECVLYVGIKKSGKDLVTATLFAVNNSLAYNHVLSVSFPLDILSGNTNQAIQAVLYAYIPLQNVTEKFFTGNIKNLDL